jgi:hypothetical protein
MFVDAGGGGGGGIDTPSQDLSGDPNSGGSPASGDNSDPGAAGNSQDPGLPDLGPPPAFDPNALSGLQPPPVPLPACNTATLNDPNLFWASNFATPEQVDAFFQSSNAPASWDGYQAAEAFSGQGINPGLAVGIINAETSFGNNPLSERNVRDPFSSGGKDFSSSLSRGLGAVVKLENHTYTDNTPLSALENQQNDLGQLYSATQKGAWLTNVDAGFQQLAAFIGQCAFY